MPGEPHEYLRMALSDITPETSLIPRWADGTAVTAGEFRDIIALRAYHIRLQNRKSPAQKVAMSLLRSFLDAEQREQLRNRKAFIVRAASGNTYRLYPGIGLTERVTRHGLRWFAALSYCLHDDRQDMTKAMPPADLILAHLLMLNHDEREFLDMANVREVRDQLWNRAYLGRLRRARVERAAVA